MNAPSNVRDAAPSNAQLWQDLGYDIGWEASANGVIRCLSVRNRRSDIHEAVEGLNLRNVWCESWGKDAWFLIQTGRPIRQAAVRLPKALGAERLYLSARLLADGACAGTFMAMRPQQDDAMRGQAALLSKVSEARNREESYRREAEFMLRGLRALMGEAPAASKLDTLARLMVEAIGGGANLLLREGRDGSLRALNPSAAAIADTQVRVAWRGQSAGAAVYDDNSPHTGRLRKLLGVESGEIAVTVLPFASQGIVLLCDARRGQKFRTEDIGFACRFALILQQAIALKEEQDKLVQAAKLSVLGQMSASLAHELRQPLNTIGMTAQNLELMAQKGPVAPEVLAAKLSRIMGQVERASRIMDKVRQFSRKSGEPFIQTELAGLVHGVRMLSESLLQPHPFALVIDVPLGLAAQCDPIQIEQVLVNLVRNAVDAMSGKGNSGKPRGNMIAIRARRSDDGVVLRVEDSGPGFPEDFLARPVQAFFTTKSADHGTGLGLSICNTIARDHAGRLELGNHHRGAYVDLYLPARLS